MSKMQTVVTEKPMYFACDCGEQFLLGKWVHQKERNMLVVRFLQDHRQFYCCPFCGGKMSGKEMRREHGPV